MRHGLVLVFAGLVGLTTGCSVEGTSRALPNCGQEETARTACLAPPVERAVVLVAANDTTFTLPADETGKLLGKVLPPTVQPGPLGDPSSPPPAMPVPRSLSLDRPPPPAPPALIRLPAPVRKDTARPQFLLDEQLGGTALLPGVPREPLFSTDRPTRIESENSTIPPALPVLASPVPDRVPTDDVTAGASTAAVLSAPQPQRITPAPYQRVTQSDPFVNRNASVLPAVVEAVDPQAPTDLPGK